MRNGASAGRSCPPKKTKTAYTPSSESAATRKPETAPPRMATCTALTTPWRAAAVVRRFAFTLTYIPMTPDTMEQAAPKMNAIPVRIPRSAP